MPICPNCDDDTYPLCPECGDCTNCCNTINECPNADWEWPGDERDWKEGSDR